MRNSGAPLDPRAGMASANNVDWYVEECEAWGIAYQRNARAWISHEIMPPYHSNLLWETDDDPGSTVNALHNQLRAPWSIKDAFAKHDYSPHGFELLFSAKWYWLDTNTGSDRSTDTTNLSVTRVTSNETFEQWIQAWGETPPAQPVFHPALWRRPQVSFLYALSKQNEIVGGLAANQSNDCIGMTNCFGTPQAIATCITALGVSGLPIVGFDQVTDMEHLTDLGFEITGDLNIWISADR